MSRSLKSLLRECQCTFFSIYIDYLFWLSNFTWLLCDTHMMIYFTCTQHFYLYILYCVDWKGSSWCCTATVRHRPVFLEPWLCQAVEQEASGTQASSSIRHYHSSASAQSVVLLLPGIPWHRVRAHVGVPRRYFGVRSIGGDVSEVLLRLHAKRFFGLSKGNEAHHASYQTRRCRALRTLGSILYRALLRDFLAHHLAVTWYT